MPRKTSKRSTRATAKPTPRKGARFDPGALRRPDRPDRDLTRRLGGKPPRFPGRTGGR